jgi:Zn-dependent protease with chaperone function
MRGLADAALLAVVAIGSCAGVPRLVKASWPRRSPAAAILLWQALGLACGLAAVGALLNLAMPGDRSSVAGAFWRLRMVALAGRHGPAILVMIRICCLTAGLALFTLLCWVLVAATAAVIQARRRQRILLALLAHGDPKVPGALVVDHPAAAAYCLPGLRASRIVVSAGALELLGPAELAAVLAHERAHLRERHDLVLLPFTALRRAFPRSRMCTDAYHAVALLVEMLADDRALRARPARELVSALVRVGTAGHVPAGALAVSEGAEGEVAARVARLLRPVRPLPAPAVAAICAGAALLAAAPAVLLIW